MRISFDYDGTASTVRGRALLNRALRKKQNNVFVISARRSKSQMVERLKGLGISTKRIYAVGSNANKLKKIQKLQIHRHYDNRQDVTTALGSIGVLFKK
jgi:hypothetical protein